MASVKTYGAETTANEVAAHFKEQIAGKIGMSSILEAEASYMTLILVNTLNGIRDANTIQYSSLE